MQKKQRQFLFTFRIDRIWKRDRKTEVCQKCWDNDDRTQ